MDKQTDEKDMLERELIQGTCREIDSELRGRRIAASDIDAAAKLLGNQADECKRMGALARRAIENEAKEHIRADAAEAECERLRVNCERAQVEAGKQKSEAERLRGIVEVAAERDRALCAEKDDLQERAERLTAFVRWFQRGGIGVSPSLEPGDFADRWCGHGRDAQRAKEAKGAELRMNQQLQEEIDNSAHWKERACIAEAELQSLKNTLADAQDIQVVGTDAGRRAFCRQAAIRVSTLTQTLYPMAPVECWAHARHLWDHKPEDL
jgi:hypothetical protein